MTGRRRRGAGWTWRRRVACGLALVTLGARPVQARAQYAAPGSDTLRVVTPGPDYAAGALHRLVLGEHHRDTWTAPIAVRVLDLSTFAGGLTPTKAHTGSQTTSLRFLGADGREYQFRSVYKTPTATLSEPLRNSLVGDLIQDGASSSYPLGALVVSGLLDAAGVLHPAPVLAVLPDDEALGEYRADFAGMLGTLEERPNEAVNGRGGFAGAAKVVSPEKMFERLDASAADQVDAHAFLTARLVDILVGDRDRHRDNWRWALMDADAPVRRWLPISRDHDEAFVKHDGVVLRTAAIYQPQLVRFGPEYDRTLNLNWHAREVDRRFLAGLDRAAWDSTATALAARLTDEVIEASVRTLPAEAYAAGGAELADALRRRRDGLRGEALRYYALLAREVELRGTDERDDVRIDRVGERYVDVTIASPGAEPWLHRRFDANETHEVRIRLWDGADHVVVTGDARPPITLRVVGGAGRDSLVDATQAGEVHFYDAGDRTETVLAPTSTLDRRPYTEWVGSDLDRYPPREWGASVRPVPWVSVDPDYGALLGGGFTRTHYGFRKEPYASEVTVMGAVAMGEGWGEFSVHGDFRAENAPARLLLDARVSGVEMLHWYGYGNASANAGAAESYKVDVDALRLSARVAAPVGARGLVEFGAFGVHTSTRARDHVGYFDTVRDTLYGAEGFRRMGVSAAATFDTRDRVATPRRGTLLRFSAKGVAPIWDVPTVYARLEGEASTWLSAPGVVGSPSLALRAGGARLFGRFPFQDAAFLGGRQNLRGWQSERFAGDASLYGSAELRLRVAGFGGSIPGDFGVYGLSDVGRVFFDGASPGGWHTGVGGGVWFSLIDRSSTLTMGFARGRERTGLYAGLDVPFQP